MNGAALIPQNFPFKVNFAGLRGDLMSLQRQGWELAVDHSMDPMRDAMHFRVAGKHDNLKLRVLSGIVTLDRRYFHEAMSEGRMNGRLLDYFQHVEIPISFVAPNIEVVVYGKPNFGAVNFGDFGMRELDPRSVRRFTLDEFCVFKTFGKETEIFVPEKKIIDVQLWLQEIIGSQEEKQKEIRQRMLKDKEKLSANSFKNEFEEAPKLRLVGY